MLTKELNVDFGNRIWRRRFGDTFDFCRPDWIVIEFGEHNWVRRSTDFSEIVLFISYVSDAIGTLFKVLENSLLFVVVEFFFSAGETYGA